VFTFIIIAVAGKKNKGKVDDFNKTNLDNTAEAPTDNVAFAETTPEPTPLEVPVEPISPEPIADVSVADSVPIYESPERTMDFSDINVPVTDQTLSPELEPVSTEEPANLETPAVENEFKFDNVFEPVVETPINPFENPAPIVEETPAPVFENTFPEPDATPIEEPQPEESYNPALENTAKINMNEQFSSVFVEPPQEETPTPIVKETPTPGEETPVPGAEPQPTIDDVELPKMAEETPTEDAPQYENSFNINPEDNKEQ